MVALDVTPFVADLLGRGVPWADFTIQGDHESSYVQDGVLITSGLRSFANYLQDGDLAPTLHFRDVPEPPAAAGVLLLLLGLVARVTASAS